MITGRLADGRPVRLKVDDGLINRIEELSDHDQPDHDHLLVPGLVDIQVNGFAGLDVNDDQLSPVMINKLVRTLLAEGVTGFCPTIITAPQTKIIRALQVINEARAADPLAEHCIVGVHIEGPYLSAEDGPRGAHDAAHLRDPDPAELDAWLAAADGLIKIITIAPERDGAIDFIRRATAAGIVVAVGHTAAEPDRIRAAADAGAILSTHLGNGAHPMLPRHPNHLWAQLADDRLSASLITDGHHLPADTATVMMRAKGPGRVVLISDAAALAHCPPGDYRTPVGGAVTVDQDGSLRLAGTRLNAGSGASLLECLRWAFHYLPLPHEELIAMATETPAALLGLPDRGRIREGVPADLLLLEPDLTPAAVLVRGERVG